MQRRGLTETRSDNDEVYKEDRFRDAVAAQRGFAVPAVQRFAGEVQSDDPDVAGGARHGAETPRVESRKDIRQASK